MGISAFRLHLFSRLLSLDHSEETSARAVPLYRNFKLCPHCEKTGGPFLLGLRNESYPVISRSDGTSFHLILGDRPISYPDGRTSGRTAIKSVGFWYVREKEAGSRDSMWARAATESVVVILRRPPRADAALADHIETLADLLAEKLSKLEELARLYEFNGHRVQPVA